MNESVAPLFDVNQTLGFIINEPSSPDWMKVLAVLGFMSVASYTITKSSTIFGGIVFAGGFVYVCTEKICGWVKRK